MTTVTPPPDAADPTHDRSDVNPPPESAAGGRDPWTTSAWVLSGIATIIPVVRMIGIVLDGSKLSYNDYWLMLPRFMNADGSLAVGRLLEFQNEHPVVLPEIVYWVNARTFAGSNITLGLFVVAIVGAQVALVALMLRHSKFRPVEKMLLLVLSSALLFDLSGTWNFAKAMSGTAWLMANLFAVGAVYLRSRDRLWLALVVAAGASVSYGTGIAAWIAVIAVGCALRPVRHWWREWPAAVGFVLTFLWYQASNDNPQNTAVAISTGDYVRVATQVTGGIFGLTGTAAQLVGAIVLVGIPILALGLAVTSRTTGVGAWIGLGVFGWVATLEIVAGRAPTILFFGEQGRYSSLPALGWIGFAAMSLVAVRSVGVRLTMTGRRRPGAVLTSPWIAALLVLPLLVASLRSGQGNADEMQARVANQKMAEIALRLDDPDLQQYLAGAMVADPVPLFDLLADNGQYPFTADWPLDCGLLNTQLDPALADQRDPAARGEIVKGGGESGLLRAQLILGWVAPASTPVRCVIVTNRNDKVIGVGSLSPTDDPATNLDTTGSNRIAFRALAKGGGQPYHVYVLYEGDDQPHRIEGDYIPAGSKVPK